jgi:hypothetical protein
VLSTGFRRIAVSGAVVESPDPANEVKKILKMLGN